MRRKNLRVRNKDTVIKILDRAKTLHLGLNNTPYPYVVPLSYGYRFEDGNLEFYIHGASEGLKHDLISENNEVCVEIDYTGEYKLTKKSATIEYGSIIAYGEILEVVENDEKINALKKLSSHCTFKDLEINSELLEVTKVYKILITKLTAKSNMKD